MLSDDQVQAYERDGVVHPMAAFDAAVAERYRRDLVRDCTEGERSASDAGPRQVSTRVKSYLLFPWAAALVRTPAVLDAVERVIGPDILVFHSTVWLKPAGSEGVVPWHQDGTYFGLEPFEHVTAWVALSASTREAGCVEVLPGSHRAGQRAHRDAKDSRIMLSRGQSVADPVDAAAARAIELEPGEFSLHHTMVLHASRPNRAAHDRVGIGISYIPARVRHVGTTRLSATLVRGTDRFGHFDHEGGPSVAVHADSLARFWRASEAIPEMAMVH